MRYTIVFLTISLCWVNAAEAQIPLNKRDQKRKAEFEAQIQAEENYKKTITEADRAFREKRYADARQYYYDAKAFDPNQEQWLTSKVNDLDILMAKNVAAMVDSIRMVNVLPAPDVVAIPTKTSHEPQVLSQKEATLDLSPSAAPEEPKKQAEPVSKPQLPPTPLKESPKVVREDLSKLPQGITEEDFEFPDHKVKRIVVKEGIDVIVYKRVTHRWGGDYCFRDDISVSERQWLEEIEAYRKKFPSEK